MGNNSRHRAKNPFNKIMLDLYVKIHLPNTINSIRLEFKQIEIRSTWIAKVSKFRFKYKNLIWWTWIESIIQPYLEFKLIWYPKVDIAWPDFVNDCWLYLFIGKIPRSFWITRNLRKRVL